MNIVYLIGNGFDIAQGCNTSYPAFYEYLKQVNTGNRLLKLMVQQLTSDKYELWKDLEKALGEFSVEATSNGEFIQFLGELRRYLILYLKKQNELYSVPDEFDMKYLMDLLRPDTYLSERDSLQFRSYFRSADTRIISFITFNYTDILELIFSGLNESEMIKEFGQYKINTPLKVHGSLSSGLMMGVDNSSQIQNQEFREDEFVQNILVKPITNYSNGSMVDEKCKTAINVADILVFMGLSLGETDKTWWHEVGLRLISTNVLVLYFVYDKDYSTDDDVMRLQRVLKAKEDFINACGIPPKDASRAKQRILVGINTNMFKPVPDDRVDVQVL